MTMAAIDRLNRDPDQMSITNGPVITQCDLTETGIQIHWSDGRSAHFLYLWLRDNCLCELCYHPQAWEKMHDILDIDPDIKAETCEIADGVLAISWAPDGHRSRFTSEWLRRFCYADWARAERRPKLTTWGAEISNQIPRVDHTAVMTTDEGLRQWLSQLREFGFSIVTGTPCETDQVTKTAERIGFLRQTHFGVDYSVIAKDNPDNVAYTPIKVASHTDLSNCEMPPGIQMLHCIKFEAKGGQSVLVDGFAVAEKLRAEDPDAFDILTRTSIPSRFHDHDWDISFRSPVITLDDVGDFSEIRYNRQLEAPLDLSEEEIVPYFRARQAYTRILRRSEQELRFRLNPGEIMTFHNRRVMHGREAFDAGSGARHLQGCYVDCDQAWSRLRVLERQH